MALYQWTGKAFRPRTFKRTDLGADVYLCCPGPSLADVDADALRATPGAVIFAVNTAYPKIRPDVWVGLDRPECYAGDLFAQPFMKVCGSRYSESTFFGRKIKEAAGVYFLNTHDKTEPRPWQMFSDERLVDHPDFVWCKNTFHTALHLAVWMGARRIYLVGTDFGGGKDYHDDRKLNQRLRAGNEYLLDQQVLSLPMLRMHAVRTGRELISCTPGSRGNEHLPYVPLAEAMAATASRMPNTSGHKRVHAYLANNSVWWEHQAVGDGVITGADSSTEWMLPWWLGNLRRDNPHVAVTFADFGMTSVMLEWCEKRGRVVKLRDTRLHGWLNKPSAICAAPYERIIWLDTDVEVQGDISELFDHAEQWPIAAAVDGHNPADAGLSPRNMGVLVVKRGAQIVTAWARAILSDPEAHRGDQEFFNAMIDEQKLLGVGTLPKTANWQRLDGKPTGPVLTRHWTGPVGKAHILRQAMPNRGGALAACIMERFGAAPIRGAEIGVLAGRLSATLLQIFPRLRLLMIDPWEVFAPDSRYAQSGDAGAMRDAAQVESAYRWALAATDFAADRREILRGRSVPMAEQVEAGSLDFVFIDGDHSRAGVLEDLRAWTPKVKEGGLIGGHDWLLPDSPGFDVRGAVIEFMKSYGVEVRAGGPIEMGPGYCWFMTKPKARSETPAPA